MNYFDLTLKRDGLAGIDEKSDVEIICGWLRNAQAGPAQNDPFLHLLWARLFDKIAVATAAKEKVVEITEQEFLMIKLALIRSNIATESTLVYVQLLAKVGIDLQG